MDQPLIASDYMNLGEWLRYLREATGKPANRYSGSCDQMRACLEKCGFSHALSAASKLPKDPSASAMAISHDRAKALDAMMSAISGVVYKEADGRQTIVLQTSEVTMKLRDLPTLLPEGRQLTVSQRELQEETVRCIECGAYRAAAVMGWNLAYDYMRQWVFDNRLTDLKKGLLSVCPKAKEIKDYVDFFDKRAPSERDVIDAMARQESGPIIGGEGHDNLIQYLRYRNKYAHASEKSASVAKTNYLIEHLIDIITTVPPFVQQNNKES